MPHRSRAWLGSVCSQAAAKSLCTGMCGSHLAQSSLGLAHVRKDVGHLLNRHHFIRCLIQGRAGTGTHGRIRCNKEGRECSQPFSRRGRRTHDSHAHETPRGREKFANAAPTRPIRNPKARRLAPPTQKSCVADSTLCGGSSPYGAVGSLS